MLERLKMALLAQMSPIKAYIGGNVAAKSALVVDKFSAVTWFVAVSLTDSHLLDEALLASKILLGNASFFS